MRLENRTQLDLLREQCIEKRNAETRRILVFGGTGCLAGGSQKIYEKMLELAEKYGKDKNIQVEFGEEIAHTGVKKSGCHGFCEMGPLVRIEPFNYLYLKTSYEDCEEIFKTSVIDEKPVERLMYHQDGKVYET